MSAPRAGFVAVVGRPNVGKSTLVNALVGDRVAITGPRPQTTRRALRGIVHHDDGQLVLVDTPGVHRPRSLLGERLNDTVRSSLAAVDAALLCVPADQPVGPGDRFVAAALSDLPTTPVLAAVTRADLADRDTVGARLLEVAALGAWREVLPVSAVSGFQVGLLADLLLAALPEGPPLFPAGMRTDTPDEVLIAELVREQALDGVRDELPHSLAVTVEDLRRRTDGLVEIDAVLWVERPSQKPIVIGAGGARLKGVGTRARGRIEPLLGARVYLDLRVKVAKDWQRDPRGLRRLGF